MNWFEMLFGLSPDGGNGSLELLLSFLVLSALVALRLPVTNRYAMHRFTSLVSRKGYEKITVPRGPPS